MRLLVATLFVGSGIACCCGLPKNLDPDQAAEGEPAQPTVEIADPPPAVVSPREQGPTTIAFLAPKDGDCALEVQTLGQPERILALLKGECPRETELVVHPDGSRALLVDAAGVTTIDVATATPSRLPPLEHVLFARWNAAGAVVALTSQDAPEMATDAKGKFFTVDGQRLDVTEENAAAYLVGRVQTLDGPAWKQDKILLGAAQEGMTEEEAFAATAGELLGKAPNTSIDRPKELGAPMTTGTPGPGEWRQDGELAFQFEWLEGVMPHGPAALHLADGSWKTLPGFETGALSWVVRADVVWIQQGGGPSAVFDVKTGEEKWRTPGPAWLLPLDLTLVPTTTTAPPPPPPAVVGRTEAQPRRPQVDARRAEPRPAREARPEPPPPAAVEEEEETPAYEPPPDLDTPDADEPRRRKGKKHRDR